MKFFLSVACVASLFFMCCTHQSSAELMAWYQLEGDATDSSGKGHDGAIIGTPAFVTGTTGLGIDPDTDTVDGYIKVVGGLDYSTIAAPSFTVSYWATVDADGGNENYALTQGQGTGNPRYLNQFGHANADNFKTEVQSLTGMSGKPSNIGVDIDDGDYHSYIFRYDASATENHAQSYVDGILLGQTNVTLDGDEYVGDTASEIRIGARSIWFSYFRGEMDDVAIWDHAVTDVGIADIVAGVAPSLIDFVPEFDPDINDDGNYDGEDLNLLLSDFDPDDTTGIDGPYSQEDLETLLAVFGSTVPGESSKSVPEPGSSLLLLFGIFWWFPYSRHK